MSLDWSNERYVRLYTRDTDEWLVLPWQARAVWPLLLRKVDRSGVLPAKLGPRGVAVLIGLPLEVVEPGIAGLLDDGCLVQVSGGYVIPNFIEAQEARASDAQRQRESRERRRAGAISATEERKEIYVAKAQDGSVKIGISSDVRSRIRSINTGRTEEVELVASWPGNEADERAVHELWSHLRIKGEWFKDDGISSWALGRHSLSHSVTSGHEVSQPVTPCCAVPSRSEPFRDLSLGVARDPTVQVATPGPAPAPAPKDPGQLGELLKHAIRRLDAARAELDPSAKPIGSALHVGAPGELLRARLRPLGSDARKAALDHCLDVLIAKARASGAVGDLRLGMLAGEHSWPRWLAETPETYSSPRAPPATRSAKPGGRYEPPHPTTYQDGEIPL